MAKSKSPYPSTCRFPNCTVKFRSPKEASLHYKKEAHHQISQDRHKSYIKGTITLAQLLSKKPLINTKRKKKKATKGKKWKPIDPLAEFVEEFVTPYKWDYCAKCGTKIGNC